MEEIIKGCKREDPLRRRYLYKLISNWICFPMSLLIQSVIPRGLGPADYGNFNFLTNFFSQLGNFFDTGTSEAFFTKLSQRTKETKLVIFYFNFIIIISLLIMLFVLIAFSLNINNMLWPGQQFIYIYLAVFWAIFSWIAKVSSQMTDAYGLTVPAEKGRIFQKTAGLIVIIILFVSRKLNLLTFFFYNYLMLLLLIAIFIKIMKLYGYPLMRNLKLSTLDIKNYIKEFYGFSHPLFIYSLVAMLIGIFDRWFLQMLGGNIQQGFYSLSYQISAICLLFVTAMVPLITREFSIAHNNNNIKRITSLFEKYIPFLYSITAFFTCFLAANAAKITFFMGGNNFNEAVLPVAIMAFYPINQAYGQLSGSLFYATGQTRTYRNIGIITMFIGLPLTYLLVAPKVMWGIGAGAAGLAIKTVITAFIAINVQLWHNARTLRISFRRLFFHQFYTVILLGSIAFSITKIIDLFVINKIWAFIISGFAYTAFFIVMVYIFPPLLFISREELSRYTNLLVSYLKNVQLYFWER